MPFDYATIATKSLQLVTDFGRDVTFVKFDETPDDASKPWRGDLTPRETPADSQTIKAVFAHPSSATRLGLTINEEAFVGRETQIVMIVPGPTSVIDFTAFDEIIDGTVRWKITQTEVLKPGPLVMLYFFIVNR